MPTRPPVPAKATPAERFRPIIEEAVAAGVDLSQQVLHLTYSDGARLRRDRAIPEDEIRFENGEMAFIGVRVIEGAPASAFADANGVITAPEPAPIVSAMAKGQKKSNKEVRKPKAEKAKPAPAGRDFTSPPGKAR